MASMRNWLHEKKGRVVVVHCKAGKGRSGTASCSYLISEEGWPVHKALERFTERRMRPNMGKGVSIPSQLRWIDYVDRWAKHGKIYVERQVEILEVHCWGLRDGVKIQVEGFVEDGKLIKNFHTFTRDEREIVRGQVKTTGMAQAVQEVMYKNGFGPSKTGGGAKNGSSSSLEQQSNVDGATVEPRSSRESLPMGTGDVVFRPAKRVVLPTNDVNIDVERRNKAAFDLTMVTAVAHVWFNTYFEGNGPEQNGNVDQSGIFEIAWEAMDGIKGSSRKGTQAFERIAVVWRALSSDEGRPGLVITEPKEGEPVSQASPADWRGTKGVEPSEDKDLGVRTASPTNAQSDISRANSVRSENKKNPKIVPVPTQRNSGDSDTKHVRSHGPNGEEVLVEPNDAPSRASTEANTMGPTTEASDATPSNPLDNSSNVASDARFVDQPTGSHESGGRIGGIAESLKYHVSGTVHTNDLPDGKPESDMKNAKEHGLGHMYFGKKKTSL
jgi:hypothetical protein